MPARDQSLGFNVFAQDRQAAQTFLNFSRQVDKLTRSIERLDRQKADPEVDVDTRKAEKKVGAFAKDLQADIRKAVESLPDVELGADASDVDRKIAQVRRQLAALSDQRIGIDIGADEARRKVGALLGELKTLGAQSPDVEVRVNTAEAIRALGRMDTAADKAGRSFGARFGDRAMLSINQRFKVWGAVIGAAAVPVGATAGAALASGFAVGLIGVSAAAASTNAEVKAEFVNLKQGALVEVRALGEQTSGLFVQQMQVVRGSFRGVGSDIADSVNEARPAVHNLTGGIIDFSQGAMPGMLRAVSQSEPVMAGMRVFMGETGRSVGMLGTTVARNSHDMGLSWVHLSGIVQTALGLVDRAIEGSAKAFASHGGEITTLLDNVSTVATNLGSGALPVLGSGVTVALGALNGLLGILGPISDQLGVVGGIALTTWGAFRAAQGASTLMDRLGTRLDTVADRMTTTQTGAQRFSGGMATAAGRTAGLTSRIGGFLTAGAGPLGWALAAGGVALSLFGQAQADAAQRTAQNKQSVQNLTAALVESGGAIDNNVRQLKLQEIQQASLASSGDDVTDSFNQFGISAGQLTDAVLHGGPALAGMRTKLRGIVDRGTITTLDDYGGKVTSLSPRAQAARAALQWLNDETRNTKTSMRAAREQLAQMSAPIDLAAVRTQGLADKMKAFADAAGDAEARGSAFADLLDQLRGKTFTLSEVQAKMFESLQELKKLHGDYSSVVDDNTGAIDGLTKKGAELTDAIGPAQENFFALADQLTQTGRGVDYVTRELTPLRRQIVDTLINKMGLSAGEANAVADALGLIPRDVALRLDSSGFSQTEQAITALRGKIVEFTAADHEIILNANDQAAIDSLTALGFKVRKLPNGKVAVYAEHGQFDITLAAIVARANGAEGWVDVLANIQPGLYDLGGFKGKIKSTKEAVTIAGDTRPGDRSRGNFKIRIDRTTGRATIEGDQRAGRHALEQLRKKVNATKGWLQVHAAPSKRFGREVQGLIDWIEGKSPVITPTVKAPKNLGGLLGALGAPPPKAEGGPIGGRGGPRDDANLIAASRGEHMWAADEVTGAGGHGQVERLRALAGAGMLPRFAQGGRIRPQGGQPPAAAAPPTSGAAGAAAGAAAPTGVTVGVGTDPASVAALTGAVQTLTGSALLPLAAQLDTVVQPALQATQLEVGLNTTGAVTRLATTLPVLTAANTLNGRTMRTTWAVNTAAATAMQIRQTGQYNALARNIGGATGRMRGAVNLTRLAASADFWQMSTAARNSTGHMVGPVFGSFRAGLARNRHALSQTENWARIKFGQMYGHAARPMRAVISGPITGGIIKAWNSLNRQFNLGRHVAPIIPRFAGGGEIHGRGTPTSDDVPIWASNKEFVVQAKYAQPHLSFLRALNAGQPEAVQAAGGRHAQGPRRYRRGGVVADTGSAFNAAIGRGVRVASQMSGKPYIWGGASRAGADCSGFQSIITNALRGQYPYRRLWSTASWAGGPIDGFVRGLRSAYAIGVSQGRPGHMAGTLAGTNAESGGSPSRVKFGAGAVGADDGQFGARFSLPVVGGRFVSGGGSFDPRPLVNQAFAPVGGLIRGVNRRWPGNIAAQHGTGIAGQASSRIKGIALRKLSAMLAVSGGSAGSPAVKNAVRAVAAQYGWGSGPQWAALDWLISRESGWDPWIKNPNSSASGLFQKMVSVHGPLERTIAGQARWGLNYIRGRYGSPLGAQAFWQRNHHYDSGGVWPSGTWGFNGTGRDERVLEPRTKDNFERLTRVLNTRYGQQLLRGPAGGDGAAAPLIGQAIFNNTSPQGGLDEVFQEFRHQVRVASKQVQR